MGACCSSAVGGGYRPEPQRLLLLGPGGVGKSTVVKQVKLHHAEGFRDAEELARAAHDIRAMLLETLRELTKHPRVAKALGPAGQLASETTLDTFVVQEGHGEDAIWRMDAQCAGGSEDDDARALQALICEHWRTKGVRKAIARLQASADNERVLDTNEWIQFWLDDCERVLQAGYVPTIEDVMKLRRGTFGVSEQPFAMDGCDFVMVDVGGQTEEMHVWAAELDKAVCGVVFVVNLADFDRVGGDKDNRLLDALDLLNSILESTPAIQSKPVVVLLNKVDLFNRKIAKGKDFLKHMRDACGVKSRSDIRSSALQLGYDFNVDAEHGEKARVLVDWFMHKVSETDTFIKAPHGKIGCFATCATDCAAAQKMISTLIDAILSAGMANAGFE